MKKKIKDITIDDFDEICRNSKCKSCSLKKECDLAFASRGLELVEEISVPEEELE